MNPAITVVHRPERERFEAQVEGRECVADYRVHDGQMWLSHTYVPGSLRGRGIAAALIEAALAHARAQGLVVRPSCSYAASYIRRHPEAQDLLA